MRQSWFKRNFGWIADDFKTLWEQLKKSEIWILIAMAIAFGILIFFGFHVALKLDSTIRLRNLGGGGCREIGNGSTAILFIGTIFLTLTIIMVFGEFAHHLDYKRRNAQALARTAAWNCVGWGAFAMAIGIAMIVLLQSYCA